MPLPLCPGVWVVSHAVHVELGVRRGESGVAPESGPGQGHSGSRGMCWRRGRRSWQEPWVGARSAGIRLPWHMLSTGRCLLRLAMLSDRTGNPR